MGDFSYISVDSEVSKITLKIPFTSLYMLAYDLLENVIEMPYFRILYILSTNIPINEYLEIIPIVYMSKPYFISSSLRNYA